MQLVSCQMSFDVGVHRVKFCVPPVARIPASNLVHVDFSGLSRDWDLIRSLLSRNRSAPITL